MPNQMHELRIRIVWLENANNATRAASQKNRILCCFVHRPATRIKVLFGLNNEREHNNTRINIDMVNVFRHSDIKRGITYIFIHKTV